MEIQNFNGDTLPEGRKGFKMADFQNGRSPFGEFLKISFLDQFQWSNCVHRGFWRFRIHLWSLQTSHVTGNGSKWRFSIWPLVVWRYYEIPISRQILATKLCVWGFFRVLNSFMNVPNQSCDWKSLKMAIFNMAARHLALNLKTPFLGKIMCIGVFQGDEYQILWWENHLHLPPPPQPIPQTRLSFLHLHFPLQPFLHWQRLSLALWEVTWVGSGVDTGGWLVVSRGWMLVGGFKGLEHSPPHPQTLKST